MKKYIIGTIAAAFCCAVLLSTIQAQELQQGISDKILRFHVLANSDSSEDQTLKLKVRDEVGSYLSVMLSDAASMEESEEIALENLDEIEQIASEVIREEGYDYDVTVSLENCRFPEKTYGIYTFPSGNYEALRVVIGDGEGQNWWCVLYPNLCFSGSMYAVDEVSGEKLSVELTDEEYAAILENGDYEVSFKILKFMNRILE
ncbi:MAG: stage II sporulation protein R [Lachnospiraceae bacterium]|nr:stage II sporulation protein R [Lachnospiraceae bacterium]